MITQVATVLVLLSILLGCLGETVTWAATGNTGNWSVAKNWNPVKVPTSTDDVVISGSTILYIV
jgi:hypothetical protein